MTRRKKIYEGKAKILDEGPEPGTLIQYFKDDATAFNAQKKAVLEGKGVINNRISEYVMTRLNAIGVQNHFIKRLNLREQLIREVEIIPLEVVCRNVAAGSLSKRFGLPEGQALPRSIIEFYLKDDKLNDPMVSEEHITAFNWAQTQEIDDIMAMTLRAHDHLTGMLRAVRNTGRLQDRIWRHLRGRLQPRDPGRRSQPRQLPAVGFDHQREDGQGPL